MSETVQNKSIYPSKPTQSIGKGIEIQRHLRELQAGARIVGAPDTRTVPLPKLTDHEYNVTSALSHLPKLGKLVTLKSPEHEETRARIVIAEFHTPESYEPYVRDSQGNEITIREFCAMVAGGWAISLVDKPAEDTSA